MPTPAPADDPPTEGLPASAGRRGWWAGWRRNRRRWFYLGLVAVTVGGLYGGWVWWYRADFPLPRFQSLRARIPTAQPWWDRQMEGMQTRLVIWKWDRETQRLHLEGTVWEQVGMLWTETSIRGTRIEFGTDGCFYWRQFPSIEDEIGPIDPFGLIDPVLANQILERWKRKNQEAFDLFARVNGSPFRFWRDRPPNVCSRFLVIGGSPNRITNNDLNLPNLEIGDGALTANVLFQDGHLLIDFHDVPELEGSAFHLFRFRPASPEASGTPPSP
ncbi:MAG: hypothetical protein KDL87_05675 [Verrucomicrobiae bacterium]|nr:hypothetical protein [Verrucomicrobiae bacterium]